MPVKPSLTPQVKLHININNMMRKIFFICLAGVLFILNACSKKDPSNNNNNNNPPVITGMFASPQFTDAQIKIETIIYNKRPNFRNLQYTSEKTKDADMLKDELSLDLDLFVGPNAVTGSKLPLLVLIHGGGFVSGDKIAWYAEGLSYAKAGYVCASINYRLTKGGGNATPALRLMTIQHALEDAQNAIRYLKKNAGKINFDTTRIVVMGSSAGGALSLLNAVYYDSGLGTNDYFGFSSKTQGSISTGASLFNEDADLAPNAFTFDATDSPVLMFHAKEMDGADNNHTWTGNAVPTQQAINNSGNKCILIPQPNLSHTVSLGLRGDYWVNLQPFLWDRLRINELLSN